MPAQAAERARTRRRDHPGCPAQPKGSDEFVFRARSRERSREIGAAGLRRGTVERKLRAVTLRVLHVDTERGWRGGERQTLWLAQELARRGHLSIVAARLGEPLSARATEAG